MLISQINAVDSSNIQFATNRAAEALSTEDGGFSAYLAQIMDSEYETFSGDVWASEYAAPGVLTTHAARDDEYATSAAMGAKGEPGDKQYQESGLQGHQDSSVRKDHKPTSDSDAHRSDAYRKDSIREPRDISSSPVETKSHKSDAPQSTAGRRASARPPRSESQGKASSGAPTADGVTTEVATGLRQAADEAGGGGSRDAGSIAGITVKSGGASAETGLVAEIDVQIGEHLRKRQTDSAGTADSTKRKAAQKTVRGSVAEQAARAEGEKSQKESARAGNARIEVRDLRAAGSRSGRADGQRAKDDGPSGSGSARTARGETGTQAGASFTGATPGAESDGTADSLANPVAGNRLDGAGTTTARPATSLMRNTADSPVLHSLRQTLNDQVNGEIVRAARMVVRGKDTGEIRLHLKPETLGNVRITLQMHEGHIAGRIIVENSSVREVFEQNLEDLIRAFNESGLETGTLDVALSNSGDGPEEQAGGGKASRAVRELDRAVPTVQTVEEDHDLVDLMV